MKDEDIQYIYRLGIDTIKSLEVEKGILASGKKEIYGCIFGRDSLVTSLKLLRAYNYKKEDYFLTLVRKILLGLAELQGKDINIESGEEPGKCIHEFRISEHEHLTIRGIPPWYVYPDNTMRNFDSVDATPLFLIAIYRYWQKTKDKKFMQKIIDHVVSAINWIMVFGDINKDGFIDYQMHLQRKRGGLITQNWMDSSEAIFHEDSENIIYPIAPVEAQGYSYLALRLWAKYFSRRHRADVDVSALNKKASKLKKDFNKIFIVSANPENFKMAHALDGNHKPLVSLRSSIGHVLWSCMNLQDDKKIDGILYRKYVGLLVKKILEPEIFEETAGIRTLGKKSRAFDANSYHNGSIWPHDNSLIAEGMENYGFIKEANRVREAEFMAWQHFGTPIELFVFFEGKYKEYRSTHGQIACRTQAWSAASMIADVLAYTSYDENKTDAIV
ncbi:MAG: Amylo-alpha-16-glucosidase [Parcubacteria group bacterium GW2011_GWE2_39_37]|nr:MAG: Amylo-alpha-16-glucosidase [Parcubacteria group bacterium GW2011_GWE2_39_37]